MGCVREEVRAFTTGIEARSRNCPGANSVCCEMRGRQAVRERGSRHALLHRMLVVCMWISIVG